MEAFLYEKRDLNGRHFCFVSSRSEIKSREYHPVNVNHVFQGRENESSVFF
jgi:hypothetical protein